MCVSLREMIAAMPTSSATDPKIGDLIRDALATTALGRGAGIYEDVEITEAVIDGVQMRFATDMQRDPIQRRHRAGAFFEPEELELIGSYLPAEGTFVDIGANVGNHSLFAAKMLGAKRVLPFEPNTLAFRLLILNTILNGAQRQIAFDYLGYGASDLPDQGFGMTERDFNLGAARMVEGGGDIPTLRPDDVLRDEKPHVIKIDVEGMEMAVLRGLQKTVQKHRPILLVECDRANIHDFADWRLAHAYAIPVSIKHYAENRNFLLVPEERGIR